jgi:hypothetical protein
MTLKRQKMSNERKKATLRQELAEFREAWAGLKAALKSLFFPGRW